MLPALTQPLRQQLQHFGRDERQRNTRSVQYASCKESSYCRALQYSQPAPEHELGSYGSEQEVHPYTGLAPLVHMKTGPSSAIERARQGPDTRFLTKQTTTSRGPRLKRLRLLSRATMQGIEPPACQSRAQRRPVQCWDPRDLFVSEKSPQMAMPRKSSSGRQVVETHVIAVSSPCIGNTLGI
jgi:hypothetical protein